MVITDSGDIQEETPSLDKLVLIYERHNRSNKRYKNTP